MNREVPGVVRLHTRQGRDQGIRARASAATADITRKGHERLAVETGLYGLGVRRNHAGCRFYIDCSRDLADLKADIDAQRLARD